MRREVSTVLYEYVVSCKLRRPVPRCLAHALECPCHDAYNVQHTLRRRAHSNKRLSSPVLTSRAPLACLLLCLVLLVIAKRVWQLRQANLRHLEAAIATATTTTAATETALPSPVATIAASDSYCQLLVAVDRSRRDHRTRPAA